MSWTAHDFEPYAIERHLGGKLAFLPLLIGSYTPDFFTKWFVYGVHVGGWDLKATDPVQFHRGWPGAGFTHSLSFGLLIGALIALGTRNKVYGLSFVIGHWAHSITDTGDTVGTMLFFPFTTYHVHFGAWAYAGQTGRFTDAAAYFSGPGGVAWEGFWLVVALASWRVLTTEHFREKVVPADGFWRVVSVRLTEPLAVTLYRTAFFYGAARWVGWMLWAHVLHHYPFDVTWGGPHWVHAAHPK
jgi:hypothetical protein